MYAERFGVSDAAKERKVLAIGNVIDTQSEYPETVVASALWHMEPTIDRAIAQVKSGTFTAEDYGQFSLMKFGGASLAPLGMLRLGVWSRGGPAGVQHVGRGRHDGRRSQLVPARDRITDRRSRAS